MSTSTPRESYIAFFDHYLRASHRPGVSKGIQGLWVTDPLDVTQVVFRDPWTGRTCGIETHEPVESDWAAVPALPAMAHLDSEGFTRFVNRLDPDNQLIHTMVMNLFIAIDEPHEMHRGADGIWWVGTPGALLDERFRVDVAEESA